MPGAVSRHWLGGWQSSRAYRSIRCVPSAWARFAAADTLIHVDLPLLTHCRWVTKRLVKSMFVTPEGWPEGSPIWSSTMNSYRVLWLCHRHLTPRYRQLVADAASTKQVHHLTSPAEMRTFLEEIEQQNGSPSGG